MTAGTPEYIETIGKAAIACGAQGIFWKPTLIRPLPYPMGPICYPFHNYLVCWTGYWPWTKRFVPSLRKNLDLRTAIEGPSFGAVVAGDGT